MFVCCYRYSSDFTVTVYRKPIGWLKLKKSLVADFELKDPNGTLLNGQSFVIVESPKKFYQRWWFYTLVGAAGATYVWKR